MTPYWMLGEDVLKGTQTDWAPGNVFRVRGRGGSEPGFRGEKDFFRQSVGEDILNCRLCLSKERHRLRGVKAH